MTRIPPPFKSCSRPLSFEAREDLFQGALLVAEHVPAMVQLVDHARHMLQNAFYPGDVLQAFQEMDRSIYLDRVRAVRRAFDADTGIQGLMVKLIDQLGGDPADAYADRLNLRVLPPGGLERPANRLPQHRDTWGSNVMAQINVWAPIAPLDTNATMVLYPDVFTQAVPNTSRSWDLEVLRLLSRKGQRRAYPHMPVAEEFQSPASGVPAMIHPGDVLLFSGAHLHESRTSETAPTRLSFDTRLVFSADHMDGKGAANVDGLAPRQPLDWFHALKADKTLSKVVKNLQTKIVLSGPEHH